METTHWLKNSLQSDDSGSSSTQVPHAVWVKFLAEQSPHQGAAAFRIVDFGPGTDVNYAFTAQTVMNPLGKSPPMCSEF